MNKRKIAKILLEKKAVTLNAKEPYTYVSGIRSPVYCDNRKMIGYPTERDMIVKEYITAIKNVEFDVLAGTATAGIPWAAFIAQKLKKPMTYTRAEKKEHGAGNQIEGASIEGKKVIVIEDLISTGGSSFKAVEACRQNRADVVMVVAIFTYEFEKAKNIFEGGNCKYVTLSDFSTLVKVAKKIGYLDKDEIKIVMKWNKSPAEWGPKNGFPNAEPKV
ncbi:MAG: orotate phosphoribosyltransferase [Nanoarchaeota archaeon]